MGQRGFLFGAEITNRCRINGIYTVTNITVTNLKVYPNIYSPENIFLLKWNSTIVSQLFNNYCSKTSTVTNQRSEADTEFFPALIWKSKKKCPDFGKKDPNCIHARVESSIQNVVLTVYRGKRSKILPCGAFFLVFLTKCSPALKNFWLRACKWRI